MGWNVANPKRHICFQLIYSETHGGTSMKNSSSTVRNWAFGYLRRMRSAPVSNIRSLFLSTDVLMDVPPVTFVITTEWVPPEDPTRPLIKTGGVFRSSCTSRWDIKNPKRRQQQGFWWPLAATDRAGEHRIMSCNGWECPEIFSKLIHFGSFPLLKLLPALR
jgi:hypothetical protein